MKMLKHIPLLPISLAAVCLTRCAEALQKDLTRTQVLLTAPANRVVSTDTGVSLVWQPVEDASAYELQLVTPRFDSIVSFTADTTVTISRFQTPKLKRGNYAWRVRAMNSGSTSLFSDSWNFTMQ